jgi:hypothetical protein
MHDPRIGRFFAVDPLAPEYPHYTPYSFSGNEVIHMVELEGLEPTIPPSQWGMSDDYKDYGDYYHQNSKLEKVDGYWVITNTEAITGYGFHKTYSFYNEDTKKWEDFYATPEPKPSCLSCDLKKTGNMAWDEAVKYGGPIIQIGLGIVGVALAIPTGGASLTITGAVLTSFYVISGSYMFASGSAELVLAVSGNEEEIKKIPGSFLEATVGLTLSTIIDNKETMQTINATLNVVEGVVTLKFKNASDLDNYMNAATATVTTINLIDNTGESEPQDTNEE